MAQGSPHRTQPAGSMAPWRVAAPWAASPGPGAPRGREDGDLLSFLRAALWPLGLLALLAVGLHAAADTLDDRFLALVDAADAWADGWLGRAAWSAPSVDWLDLGGRLLAARGLALVWELLTLVWLGRSLFPPAPAERPAAGLPSTLASRGSAPRTGWARWKQLAPRLPWALVPLAITGLSLAGAAVLARMLHASLASAARSMGLGHGVLGLAGGVAAVLGGAVALSLGVSAVVRSVRWVLARALPREGLRARPASAAWTALCVVPLLWLSAAWLRAPTPPWSW